MDLERAINKIKYTFSFLFNWISINIFFSSIDRTNIAPHDTEEIELREPKSSQQ